MTDMVPIMRDGEIVQVPADTVFTLVEPGPAPVPQAVTPAQAKLALVAAGKYEQAQQLIDGAGIEAQIYWNSALSFERKHPLIEQIGFALNLTEEDIDELFTVAATL